MTCIKRISQNVINSCRSIKGLKPRAYWAYRTDLAFTFSGNVITAINGFPVLGIIDGIKSSLNAGHELVSSEDNGDGYKHKFTAIANVIGQCDNLDDVVVFVQNMSGQWLCYGAKYGLWQSAQSQMANDNLATTSIELTSLEGKEEPYESYTVTSDLTNFAKTDLYEVISLTFNQSGTLNAVIDPSKVIVAFSPSKNLITPESPGVIDKIVSEIGVYKLAFEKATSQISFNSIGCIGDISIISPINVIVNGSYLVDSAYCPNSNITFSDMPMVQKVSFNTQLDATGCSLTASSIERILLDKVTDGKIVNIDFTGAGNAVYGSWSANAKNYKNILVARGSTIIYNS